ncbi:MAG: HD domain-containing phosphohydrolase [bacterium]
MLFDKVILIFASSTALLTISLFYLYFKNRDHKNFLHAGLFFLCCSLAIFAQYHIEGNFGPAQAIFWAKMLYIAIFGFIYTFPLFIASLIRKEPSKRTKYILGAITLVCFAFIGITDLVITNQPVMYLNILQARKGPLYPLFIAMLLLINGGYYVKASLMQKPAIDELKQTPLVVGVSFGFLLCALNVAGTLLKRPLIPWFCNPFVLGMYIIVVSFAWVFLRQYSWIFKNLTKTRQEVERLTVKSTRDFVEFVQLIAKTLDAKDHYTAGHSLRVMDYAVRIANTLDIPEREIELLKQACLLHDIGKISIPDGILNKKKPLTKKERKHILKHPVIGKKILSTVSEFKGILDIIYAHHERIDGKGYPDGVSREQIPLLARILAVADTYDAMRSERPYRSAKTKESAIDELNKIKGSQLDEEIVDKFIASII